MRPLILVTNDDGVHSPGIIALFKAMKELGEAYIIAPDRERSGDSCVCLALHQSALRPYLVVRAADRARCQSGFPFARREQGRPEMVESMVMDPQSGLMRKGGR